MSHATSLGVLRRRLSRLLDAQDAVVAFGTVEPAATPAFDAAVSEILEQAGVGGDDCTRLDWTGADADAARLEALNRARDLLLEHSRIVLITTPDDAGLRDVRSRAADLLSAVDLSFALRAMEIGDALDVERLRAIARLSTVMDLTGLLAADDQVHRIRVEEVYIDLVKVVPPPPGESDGRWPILLLAQPGAGKTTWLRHLASTYAAGEDALELGRPMVPVLVPLTAYARARDEQRASLGLVEFLEAWLADQDVSGASSLEPHLDRLLLLLDGLDEIRGQQARRSVLDEVQRLVVRHPSLTVVVTGRTLVLDDLTEQHRKRFRFATIRSPNRPEVERFLQRFFAARGALDAEQQAMAAFRQIDGDSELRTLVRTPLLLVLLALLHQLEGRIPDRRTVLYHRVADILLHRWEQARSRASGAAGRAIPLGDTWRVAGALAWWMLDAGRTEVTTVELTAELTRIELARGESSADASARSTALLELLQSGSALLAAVGAGRWRFVHATLGEYFAGVDLARGQRWDAVLADPFRAEWHEVVVFCAGELGRRADDERLAALVRVLAKRRRTGGRYGARHPTLLGAVLREDPGLPRSLQRALVARYLHLSLDMRYWRASRDAVAQSLADTARVSPQRSWHDLVFCEMTKRFDTDPPHVWEIHEVSLAWRIGGILRDLEIDSSRALDALRRSVEPWQWTAWAHNVYALGDEEEREQALHEVNTRLFPGRPMRSRVALDLQRWVVQQPIPRLLPSLHGPLPSR